MPSINLTAAAHSKLKKFKTPGGAVSDVILRELPEPWETAGDVLEGMQQAAIPAANPDIRAAALSGRGRRSPRK